MERQSLYERFKILSWQQQIGSIASTLANISHYADSSAYDEITFGRLIVMLFPENVTKLLVRKLD